MKKIIKTQIKVLLIGLAMLLVFLFFTRCDSNPDVFTGVVVDKKTQGASYTTTMIWDGSGYMVMPMYTPEKYYLSVGDDTIAFTYNVNALTFVNVEKGDTITIYKDGGVKLKNKKQ